MRRLYKYLVKLIAFTIFFIFFYFYMPPNDTRRSILVTPSSNNVNHFILRHDTTVSSPVIYLWCIAVKIEDANSMLMKKFKIFVQSLLQHSNCSLSLNVLTDERSQPFVNHVISDAINVSRDGFYETVFHDIDIASSKIKPIAEVMQLHFSSVPGTYYSDSLFYISLGLHEIAPKHHNEVILLDIDIRFETSVVSLFQKFFEFNAETLLGLAPELSPVYHHILWKWRQMHPYSDLGVPSHKGYSGLNSGVMLMRLDAIRKSEEYRKCITQSYVKNITTKYFFKGHLGDQDFYTLLAMEKPHLIKILPCTWNRQLCKWWKHHGYADVFDEFARCDGQVNIYHGNCNSPLPIKK